MYDSIEYAGKCMENHLIGYSFLETEVYLASLHFYFHHLSSSAGLLFFGRHSRLGCRILEAFSNKPSAQVPQ